MPQLTQHTHTHGELCGEPQKLKMHYRDFSEHSIGASQRDTTTVIKRGGWGFFCHAFSHILFAPFWMRTLLIRFRIFPVVS